MAYVPEMKLFAVTTDQSSAKSTRSLVAEELSNCMTTRAVGARIDIISSSS